MASRSMNSETKSVTNKYLEIKKLQWRDFMLENFQSMHFNNFSKIPFIAIYWSKIGVAI